MSNLPPSRAGAAHHLARLKVTLLSLPPRTQAVLEYFIAGAGRSAFAPSNELAADAAIFDHDNPDSRRHWEAFHREYGRPGILLSVLAHDEPGTVWVQKPATPAALVGAAARLAGGDLAKRLPPSTPAGAGSREARPPAEADATAAADVRGATRLAAPGAPGEAAAAPAGPSSPATASTPALPETVAVAPAAADDPPAPRNGAAAPSSGAAGTGADAAAAVRTPAPSAEPAAPTPVASVAPVAPQATGLPAAVDVAATAAPSAPAADAASPSGAALPALEAASAAPAPPAAPPAAADPPAHPRLSMVGEDDDRLMVEAVESAAARTEGPSFFSMESTLLQSVCEALRVARKWNSVAMLDTPAGVLIIDAPTNRAHLGFAASQLAPLCAAPLAQPLRVQMLASRDLARLQEEPGRLVISDHADALVWRVALLTSRGRLPAGTNTDAVLYLRRWPNATRLPRTPDALRISALLAVRGASLVEAVRLLGVPQRWVFACYSGLAALDLVTLDGSHLKRRQRKAPRNRTIFARLFRWLRGQG